jgi:hypothetical protein
LNPIKLSIDLDEKDQGRNGELQGLQKLHSMIGQISFMGDNDGTARKFITIIMSCFFVQRV